MQRPDYEFEKYLEGDHPLSQQFAEEMKHTPAIPADMEQRILHAAHRSASKRSPQWRWLSVAASLVLVSVLYRSAGPQFAPMTAAEPEIIEQPAPIPALVVAAVSPPQTAEIKQRLQTAEAKQIRVKAAAAETVAKAGIAADSDSDVLAPSPSRLYAQLRTADTDGNDVVSASAAMSKELDLGVANKQCLLSQFESYTEKQLALEQWSRHWLQVRYPQLAQLAVARQEQRSWRLEFERQLVKQIGQETPQLLPYSKPFAEWAASFSDEALESACQGNGALCASLASWRYQQAQAPETLAQGFAELYRSPAYQQQLYEIPATATGCKQ